jgi:hypothetical protein
MLQALLLFWLILTVTAGIVYHYRLARWWHAQRQLPRPVQVGELRGEVTLFEHRGETLGWLRLWPADDES